MATGRKISWSPPFIFRMRFLKREVSASQCGAGNARIADDFAVCASSGGSRLRQTARLANLRFIPLRWFGKAMAIAFTSHILEEIVTCLNDPLFTTAARLNRSRHIKGRLRFGTSESAPRACRRKTGA